MGHSFAPKNYGFALQSRKTLGGFFRMVLLNGDRRDECLLGN